MSFDQISKSLIDNVLYPLLSIEDQAKLACVSKRFSKYLQNDLPILLKQRTHISILDIHKYVNRQRYERTTGKNKLFNKIESKIAYVHLDPFLTLQEMAKLSCVSRTFRGHLSANRLFDSRAIPITLPQWYAICGESSKESLPKGASNRFSIVDINCVLIHCPKTLREIDLTHWVNSARKFHEPSVFESRFRNLIDFISSQFPRLETLRLPAHPEYVEHDEQRDNGLEHDLQTWVEVIPSAGLRLDHTDMSYVAERCLYLRSLTVYKTGCELTAQQTDQITVAFARLNSLHLEMGLETYDYRQIIPSDRYLGERLTEGDRHLYFAKYFPLAWDATFGINFQHRLRTISIADPSTNNSQLIQLAAHCDQLKTCIIVGKKQKKLEAFLATLNGQYPQLKFQFTQAPKTGKGKKCCVIM